MDVLFRLKRINEMGTQQLLLDVYNLKTLLLQASPFSLPFSCVLDFPNREAL